MIVTSANLFSLLRGLLAFVFLIDNVYYRIIAIALAGITDGLDGYLARRYHTISRFSAQLDAWMDKFFVCFILVVFLYEGSLQVWEMLAFLARDIAYLIFGIYLIFRGYLFNFELRVVWYSKVFTTIQFFILIVLTMGLAIPIYIYMGLVLVSLLTLGQLYNALEGDLSEKSCR